MDFDCSSELTKYREILSGFQPEERGAVELERRNSNRFLPQGRTFVVFRPQFAPLARVTDISQGGLGCEYACIQGAHGVAECPMPLEIDMIRKEEDFYISRIPCSVVYDVPVSEDIEDSVNTFVETRRCGVRFEGPTALQAKELGYFLAHHVIREVPAE